MKEINGSGDEKDVAQNGKTGVESKCWQDGKVERMCENVAKKQRQQRYQIRMRWKIKKKKMVVAPATTAITILKIREILMKWMKWYM